jgi:type III restriction enzyme
MACHALGIVAREYLRAERTLCLWLVPSNAIREQTLKALRNPRHSYRQALDSAFGGNVTVMDLAEALYLQRGTLDSDTVVVVTTLQSPRVAETDSRKVYEENGALQHHFDAIHSEASADQHSLRHSSCASHSTRTTTLRASSTKDPSSSQSTSSTPSAT